MAGLFRNDEPVMTFILGNSFQSKELTQLQKDVLQGFRDGFMNQHQNILQVDSYFETKSLIGKQSLRSFLDVIFKGIGSWNTTNAMALKHLLFSNNANQSRSQQSFLVQFIIGQLLKSERKSDSDYGLKMVAKIDSFTAQLSSREKDMFYAELAHYFKKRVLARAFLSI